jgi:hypothetical protein
MLCREVSLVLVCPRSKHMRNNYYLHKMPRVIWRLGLGDMAIERWEFVGSRDHVSG